jgi:hypothetical protein
MSAVDLGAGALWTLGPASVAAGMLSAFVFRWASDRTAIRRTANRILAHLLECRLFLDDPLIVLRAQVDLLRANAHLLRLILAPALILTIPSIFLFQQLSARYSLAPLRVGEAVVVSARHASDLHAPPGVRVETAAVHTGMEVAWRVRAAMPVPIELWRTANPALTIPFPAARILHLHWLIWFSLCFVLGGIGTACLL